MVKPFSFAVSRLETPRLFSTTRALLFKLMQSDPYILTFPTDPYVTMKFGVWLMFGQVQARYALP
jgi:hypothetical protein